MAKRRTATAPRNDSDAEEGTKAPVGVQDAKTPRRPTEADPYGRDPKLKDFRNWLWMIFQGLSTGKHHEPTKLQYEIAEVLQHGPKRIIISAFRGAGKTYITAAYVLWYLYWNPLANVLVVSASLQFATKFSTFCFKLLNDIPELHWMKPTAGQRYSVTAFDVSASGASPTPSVLSLGIFGQLTGTRADLIIADDVEVPSNAETQGARERLAERVREFEAILKPLADTRIIFLGTPQCEDSLYNELVKRGYTRLLWPARYPSKKWLTFNGHELAPSIKDFLDSNAGCAVGGGLDGERGQPTEASRFSETDLLERESSYGRAGFDLQYMLDTSLSDLERYPLKLRDLIVMEFEDMGPGHPVWSPDKALSLNPVGFKGDRFYGPAAINGEWRKFDNSIMAIDPAGKGADELAYAVVKVLNGVLYLAECRGLEGGYSEANLELLALRAKRHEVKLVVIEENFGQGMFNQLLTPHLNRHHRVKLESIRHSKQKELRIIDTLEPIMSNHRLVVNAKVVETDSLSGNLNRQLFFQMTRLTRDRGSLIHDDRIDVLAMAVAWLSDSVGKDVAREESRKQDRALRKLVQQAFGPTDQGTWISRITGR